MSGAEDPGSYFSRLRRGEVGPPPVFRLLGGQLGKVDTEAGRLEAEYVAGDAFLNPAGFVQGGMLGAMLDDLTASLVDATVREGEGVATLSLALSFLRPAQPGRLDGLAEIERRGRDVCHVRGTLSQGGKVVATAQAVCAVVRRPSPPA